jgi:hypothetical protein
VFKPRLMFTINFFNLCKQIPIERQDKKESSVRSQPNLSSDSNEPNVAASTEVKVGLSDALVPSEVKVTTQFRAETAVSMRPEDEGTSTESGFLGAKLNLSTSVATAPDEPMQGDAPYDPSTVTESEGLKTISKPIRKDPLSGSRQKFLFEKFRTIKIRPPKLRKPSEFATMDQVSGMSADSGINSGGRTWKPKIGYSSVARPRSVNYTRSSQTTNNDGKRPQLQLVKVRVKTNNNKTRTDFERDTKRH